MTFKPFLFFQVLRFGLSLSLCLVSSVSCFILPSVFPVFVCVPSSVTGCSSHLVPTVSSSLITSWCSSSCYLLIDYILEHISLDQIWIGLDSMILHGSALCYHFVNVRYSIQSHLCVSRAWVQTFYNNISNNANQKRYEELQVLTFVTVLASLPPTFSIQRRAFLSLSCFKSIRTQSQQHFWQWNCWPRLITSNSGAVMSEFSWEGKSD